MSEWIQLGQTTGVAVMVLVAIGLSLRSVGKLTLRKLLGNPDAAPPVPGYLDKFFENEHQKTVNQKEFTDTIQEHIERQSSSLESICKVLTVHDEFGMKRSETLDHLVKLHTDPNLPNSTAKAIDDIKRLREVALATAHLGRQIASKQGQDWAADVSQHCEDIVRKLQQTV